MGKNNKRKRPNGNVPSQISKLPTPPSDSSSSTNRLIDVDDLECTINVLEILCEFPEELSGKEMKDLKRKVHELYRVMAEGSGLGASLTSKISTALSDYRFTDALIHLFEMYTRNLQPKLGALQRWVRECDATSGADGSPGDPEALKCLDLILRIANKSQKSNVSTDKKVLGTNGVSTKDESTLVDGRDMGEVIRRKQVWKAREQNEEIQIWKMIKEGTLFDTPPPTPYPNFRAVHHVLAADRKPPNLYDSTVYGSSPGAISLSPSSSRPMPSKIDVPEVPGAFVVLDVFTPEECLQIVRAAESIGWESDEAASGSALTKNSILAKNFVWLADPSFLSHFYQSILPHVPPNAPISVDGNGGGKVRGINARFRVYQYTQNQLYRPHIDGAWPAAGLDPKTGEYIHDSSPPEDPLWSRYTLLVYLNGEGDIPKDTGCTTFFLPSDKMGVMESHSVRPIQGAVLCFPHGDTLGSLLHEGSAVGEGGVKYVIRTDLLYEAKGFGQFKPPASAGVKVGGKDEEGIGG
ncbi:uncharacterized protein I303_108542 [Kwoniella dejecticola CBS 10117]|uniref:Prolyl 4-hydroxylase alpha subunit domain-containing protein n=1 Tax=Kwoniella dejecticola CBS 10117 TaxID=1296121 RepID=A0A1A5ZX41_9TREE|nr:uncharacterized protein I303_07134 [Kwoniella dejecticola CBS 10117]OBR82375.1 hypothetical protein I303_07134 [Kwoniella dejecticola CBS 10117]